MDDTAISKCQFEAEDNDGAYYTGYYDDELGAPLWVADIAAQDHRRNLHAAHIRKRLTYLDSA
jgi:hypothetical protein